MSTIVKSVQNLPCGCQVTETADGKKEVNPCAPCALIRAGVLLSQVGQAIVEASNAVQHAGRRLGESQATMRVAHIADAAERAARRGV